jgi:RimJ/RimL family protein N-acetyltransferase
VKGFDVIYSVDAIRNLLSIGDLYDAYDGSPELKHFVPKGIWFGLYEEDELAGYINAISLNNITQICHIGILPRFRKNGSEEWGRLVADFMRENCGTKKFLAITPYEAAKKYAERVGFNYVATLINSIKKNGQLLDQFLLEMN